MLMRLCQGMIATLRRGTTYKDEGNHKQDTVETLIHLANMDEYAYTPQFVEIGVRCSNLPREDRQVTSTWLTTKQFTSRAPGHATQSATITGSLSRTLWLSSMKSPLDPFGGSREERS